MSWKLNLQTVIRDTIWKLHCIVVRFLQLKNEPSSERNKTRTLASNTSSYRLHVAYRKWPSDFNWRVEITKYLSETKHPV